MTSRENTGEAYFSTHRTGQAEGYGSSLVHVRVPKSMAQLDDEFPSGEQHYRVPVSQLRPEHFVQSPQKQIKAAPPELPVYRASVLQGVIEHHTRELARARDDLSKASTPRDKIIGRRQVAELEAKLTDAQRRLDNLRK